MISFISVFGMQNISLLCAMRTWCEVRNFAWHRESSNFVTPLAAVRNVSNCVALQFTQITASPAVAQFWYLSL